MKCFSKKQLYLKLVTMFVALLYLFMPVLLLQHMVSMASMNSVSNECTHIVSGNSICPMDVAGHYSVWQTLRLTTIPMFYSVPVPLYPGLMFLLLFIVLLIPQTQYTKTQRYRKIRFVLTELFSAGILNTKLFYI